MLSAASNNFDVKPNSGDLRQNFAENFTSLKHDNTVPMTSDSHLINKIMNGVIISKQIKNPNVMKKPRDNDPEVLDFFLYQFKCRPCQLRKGTCQDKSTCEGWHHEGERRRNPNIGPNFLYSEEPCPKLKTPGTSKWSKPTNCKDGDTCPYSHTLMEQMYHPNIYKTSLCTNFTASGGDQCQWGYFCTHAHGQKDIRNPNKKDVIKQLPIYNKQSHQSVQNNISEITNSRQLEAFAQVVSVIPKLFQKSSPIDTSSNENDNMNYVDQQGCVSQHSSDNGSPSRSYHTPLYQPSVAPLNAVSSPSSKYTSMTPSGPLSGQSTKLPQLLLPNTTYYYQPQVPTHAMTPNTASYEPMYYNSFQTFPSHLWNERQQYSWDISSNDINLRPTPLSYTHGSNVGHSASMTEISFDMYNANNRTDNPNNLIMPINNISPYNGPQRYVPAAATTNSPSQRPTQLSRPHSANFTLSNSKFQAPPLSNSAVVNQSTHHMTPPYTVDHVLRYPSQTSTYQPFTQAQPVGMQTNYLSHNNVNINNEMWSAASHNIVNNSLFPIPDIVSPKPTSPLQVPETPQTNLTDFNEQHDDNLTKEVRDNVSYYFLGDDSLLSPPSNKPEDLITTPPPRQCVDGTIQEKDGLIIAQLKAEINELKKELESEKDKKQILQAQDNDKDIKKNGTDDCRVDTRQKQANLFEKYSTCASCHVEKGSKGIDISVPCGHLVCKECIIQKGERCPICM